MSNIEQMLKEHDVKLAALRKTIVLVMKRMDALEQLIKVVALSHRQMGEVSDKHKSSDTGDHHPAS